MRELILVGVPISVAASPLLVGLVVLLTRRPSGVARIAPVVAVGVLFFVELLTWPLIGIQVEWRTREESALAIGAAALLTTPFALSAAAAIVRSARRSSEKGASIGVLLTHLLANWALVAVTVDPDWRDVEALWIVPLAFFFLTTLTLVLLLMAELVSGPPSGAVSGKVLRLGLGTFGVLAVLAGVVFLFYPVVGMPLLLIGAAALYVLWRWRKAVR